MPSTQTDDWYIERAHALYHTDGEVEIDARDVKVSRNDDGENGAYVAAWVWVPDPEGEDDK